MQNQSWYEANKDFLMATIREAYDGMAKNMGDNLDLVKGILTEEEAVTSREAAKKAMNGPSSLERLVSSCNLSPFEEKILLICAGVQVNDAYGKLISKWHENAQGIHPSFSLLLNGLNDSHWYAIAPASPLSKWHLVKQDKQDVVVNSTLKIDDSVLHYLLGINQLSRELEGVVAPVDLPLALSDTQAADVQHHAELIMADEEGKYLPVIRLKGTTNVTAALAICQQFGLALFRLNMSVPAGPREDLVKITEIWNRDAAIKGYAMYIDLEKSGSESGTVNYSIANFIEGIHSLVFVEGQLPVSLNRDQLSFSMSNPTRDEQINYLAKSLGKSGKKEKESMAEIAEVFDLDYLTIHAAVKKVTLDKRLEKSGRENLEVELKSRLWNELRESTRPSLDDLAYRIEVKATWDDIVLTSDHISTLKEIAEQVRHRFQVYKTWKFGEKLNRGLGISALFTGSSGTGKTMAAEVIANDLNLDLYRVDLSQVVNKYIGETEKNIKKIFDAAERSGVILLFDEADALFGKRSEVKDSHDRYSNIQLGYLLQRMEEYTGLAILTTNMKQSIDKAFERRIRFTIHFQPPDFALRKHIWKKVFPEASKVNGIDYEKLARVNIPGGNIRNIALNAAFKAAAECKPISMKNILHATKMEFAKMEKALSRNEIKDWDENGN